MLDGAGHPRENSGLAGSREIEVPGLPPNGQEFLVRGASVVQFRDLQIIRCSDSWDFAAFMRIFGRIG